jgi:hypothetical protein
MLLFEEAQLTKAVPFWFEYPLRIKKTAPQSLSAASILFAKQSSWYLSKPQALFPSRPLPWNLQSIGALR